MSARKQSPMFIGYARVSTKDQNLDLQTNALKNQCGKVFQEKTSGVGKQPELSKCIKSLNKGDTLVVWKLDRLGRSTGPLLVLIDSLAKRGVFFKSITENLDTKTPSGRMMLGMISVFAQYETEIRKERQTAGIEAAKKAGKRLGRPPSLTPYQQKQIIKRHAEKGESCATIARTYNVSREAIRRVISRQ